MREYSLDADGAGGFVDGEVGGIGEAVEHREADVVIADGAGKGVLFNESELLLQIEVEPSAETFGAAVVIIDRLLDLPEGFGGDLEGIALHQSSFRRFLAVSQSIISSGCSW